jgi:hypothetical protein
MSVLNVRLVAGHDTSADMITIPHLLARRAVVEDIEIEGVTIRKGRGGHHPRIPTLRLAADLAELTFKEDSQAYGIYELPVAW